MVSIRKCEAVLTAVNGGDAAGIHTRLKYLNLQHFPPGLRVGTAKRADYGLDEILAFALWFSLTQASFLPATATALVSDFWPEFARLFLAAATSAGVGGVMVEDSEETFALITGSALKTVSKGGPADPAGPARPWNIAGSRPNDLHSHISGGHGAHVVIDLAATRAALVEALRSDPVGVTQEWINDQTIEMASQEGWSAFPDKSKAPDPPLVRRREVPARGERLRERDYYFARAIELVDALAEDDDRHSMTPRLERLANYLLRPSPREEWKRWVEIDGTGVQFVWAAAALIEERTAIVTRVPEAVRTAAANRILGEDAAPGDLARLLRQTADLARFYEPAPSD